MDNIYLRVLCALLVAFLGALCATPPVRALAVKIGAIDVPKDARRMHKKPIPLIGGLAIFFGFTVSGAIFYSLFFGLDAQAITIWFGGLFIIAIGIIDDMVSLNPWIKLAGQLIAAGIAVSQNLVIDYINVGGLELSFGWGSYPLTILWIVALTNAVNLIDGLDGLACGVSAISSVSLLVVAILHADARAALLTAALCGACLGFLPYNSNPAKIFMGDTGAMFLGYTLSVLSIMGAFKTSAFLSFLIPIIIFGLPIFDTSFAFLRRIASGHSPFEADRRHLHHRLIDSGFNQRQSVLILYAICSILGLLGILLSENKFLMFLFVLAAAVLTGLLNLRHFRRHARATADKMHHIPSQQTAVSDASGNDTAQVGENTDTASSSAPKQ
ncbi:MAG: MraY family glycosyltransferase [Eubacteriales bacterium]|nr:MraY family glycosyltransferase [Eubacteriales bacterium]